MSSSQQGFRTSSDFMLGRFRQQPCHAGNAGGDLSEEMRAALGESFNADVAAAAEFELRRKEGKEGKEETFTLAKHGWDMDFRLGDIQRETCKVPYTGCYISPQIY